MVKKIKQNGLNFQEIRLVFEDASRQLIVALPNNYGNDPFFNEIRNEMAKGHQVEITDNLLDNAGNQKLDMGSPRGSGFKFNNPIDIFITFNTVKKLLFSNEWNALQSSSSTSNALTPYLDFEYQRLFTWKCAVNYAQEKKIELLNSLEWTNKEHPELIDHIRNLNNQLVHVEQFLNSPLANEEQALRVFLNDYLKNKNKLTAHGVISLFKQLITSGIFCEGIIKNVLSENITIPQPDLSSCPEKLTPLGKQFFMLDEFEFLKKNPLENMHFGNKPSLWVKWCSWISETFSNNKVKSIFRGLISTKYRAFIGDNSSMLDVAREEYRKNNSKYAVELLKNITLSTAIVDKEIIAKACYELAVIFCKEALSKKDPLKLNEAAEWVSRAALHDKGNNITILHEQLEPYRSDSFFKFFIEACYKKSPYIGIKVLEEPNLFLTSGDREFHSMDLYSVIHDANWTSETAVIAIDKIALLNPTKNIVNLNTLHNCFYKYPEACMRILRHENLCKLIHYGQQDLGSILNDSADKLIEQIEQESNTPSIELLSYIKHAQSLDLTNYNKNYTGLRVLEDKNIQLINAIAIKGESSSEFKELLQVIFTESTFFNSGIYDNKDEYVPNSGMATNL